MPTAPSDPMVGRLIDGRYQVRSRIARGGMATVYLATDLRLERRVAIKIMHGHLVDDTSFKNRFIQEARSAARLAHPNVVNVFDQGQDDDMAYLVMEYLPGITLRELLNDYGSLTPEQTIDIMEAVLSGLAAAHRAGIVHRDLKPENVLLADDGRIKIGDFGLARAASANTASGQMLLGTIAYLSPELVTRGVADTRSDIYATGIMMYEMLTGRQPFQGEQPMQIAYQHANDAVPAPSALKPEVPVELDELVLWATAKSPDHRPADAGELLGRLVEIEKVVRGERATAAIQRTMVLPSAPADEGTTRIINPAVRAVADAAAVGSDTARLTAKTKHRRVAGWWLFLLVLILAAGAGGTGWYFGSGPGSLVTVPEVAGGGPDHASSVLTDLGFTVDSRSEYSLHVRKNTVIGTSPAAGQRLHRGADVVIRISGGPAPITLPRLAGLSQEKATDAITKLKAKVGADPDKQFNDKVAKGEVISAHAGDADVSKGGASHQGATIDLVISLGPIPDVVGKSESEASGILNGVGLDVGPEANSYSDTVAKGDVISAAPQNDGVVRAGDTIILTISKGPEPVTVPPVVGESWPDAKKALTDAGFKLEYNKKMDDAANSPLISVTVTGTDPDGGTQAPKGSTVKVDLKASVTLG